VKSDPPIIKIIQRIEHDYEQKQLSLYLHKKSTDFLRSRGLRARTVLRLTICQLPDSHDYRGPSLHHWLTGFIVYEFIENILTGDLSGDMYVKFDLSRITSQLESIHPREKPVNNTWTRY